MILGKICPLLSSSSGNSVYISFGDTSFLVDAGASAKKICTYLEANEVLLNELSGIFITHAHTDHISALKTLTKKIKVPIIATNKTIEYLQNFLSSDQKFLSVESSSDREKINFISVDFFYTKHDCAGSCGYRFSNGKSSVAFCTDLGVVTDEVRKGIINSDVCYIESNHDIAKLSTGPYPPPLKKRVLSENGHLSNVSCAAELPDLLKSGTKKFILGHLSVENNLPVLAKSTAVASLKSKGAVLNEDYMLYISPKENGGKVFF